MANKTTPDRPRKTTASKKPASPQPIPINTGLPVIEDNSTSHVQPGLEEDIRRRAYELYEERGRVDGYEQEDWARAETEILARHQREKSA